MNVEFNELPFENEIWKIRFSSEYHLQVTYKPTNFIRNLFVYDDTKSSIEKLQTAINRELEHWYVCENCGDVYWYNKKFKNENLFDDLCINCSNIKKVKANPEKYIITYPYYHLYEVKEKTVPQYMQRWYTWVVIERNGEYYVRPENNYSSINAVHMQKYGNDIEVCLTVTNVELIKSLIKQYKKEIKQDVSQKSAAEKSENE